MPDFLEVMEYLLAGIVAGGINTLAGGGAVVSLSLMLFLGVPADIANGTNRLGILVQNFTGTLTFARSGLLDWKAALPLVLITVFGAIAGAYVATIVEVDSLEKIVGGVMLILLVVMIWRSTRKKKPQFGNQIKMTPALFLVMLGTGFYGGFVQAGAGLIIIVALSSLARLSLIRSNAIKMAIIFGYSIPAIAIFIWKGQIDWILAALLAIGQVIGTLLVGKYFANNPKANAYVRVLLYVMIGLTVLKTFGVFNWLSTIIFKSA
ncbi:MAG: sulfite exporter TauE/SafE family protein [Bacteroidota bacterium]